MEVQIRTNGVTELTVNANCGFDAFYSFADQLKKKLAVRYYNKLDDFDSLWYDFNYGECKLTLHYNIYFGISIYSQKGNMASKQENEMLLSIKSILEKEPMKPDNLPEAGILSKPFKKLLLLLQRIFS